MNPAPLYELSSKIRTGEPLTETEREAVATALRFSGLVDAGVNQLSAFGAGTATLSGYRQGESGDQGDAPLFAVIVLDKPDTQTWAGIQAALADDEQSEDEP